MMTFIYSIPLSFYNISTVVNFLTIAFLGIFVYKRNKDANVNKIFAIYSLTAAQWSLFYFLWLSTKEKQLAEIYLRTCMIGIALMPAAFTHFILYFVKGKVNPKIIFLNYLCSIFVVGIIYTPLFAYNFEPFLVFPCWGIAGMLFPFHLAHFFANILYSDYIMFRAIRQSDSNRAAAARDGAETQRRSIGRPENPSPRALADNAFPLVVICKFRYTEDMGVLARTHLL